MFVFFLKICPAKNQIEVCEEFLGFCALPTTDAKFITSAIIQFIKNIGLDTSKLVGKGFDGAANMTGHITEVSTRLQKEFPSAEYLTHCRNHALNLAIVASCTSVPDIRNFMNTLKELTLFQHSAKRMHILREKLKNDKDHEDLLANLEEYYYNEELLPRTRHLGFPVLSDTRWLSRIDLIHCISVPFVKLLKLLKVSLLVIVLVMSIVS